MTSTFVHFSCSGNELPAITVTIQLNVNDNNSLFAMKTATSENAFTGELAAVKAIQSSQGPTKAGIL